MLTSRDLDTIHAALMYWEQEMIPHGLDAMRPYLETDDAPLTSQELTEIRELLFAGVRYAVVDLARNRLHSTKLYHLPEEARRAAGRRTVSTVIARPSSS